MSNEHQTIDGAPSRPDLRLPRAVLMRIDIVEGPTGRLGVSVKERFGPYDSTKKIAAADLLALTISDVINGFPEESRSGFSSGEGPGASVSRSPRCLPGYA